MYINTWFSTYFSEKRSFGLKRTTASLSKGLWSGLQFFFALEVIPLKGVTNPLGFLAAAKRILFHCLKWVRSYDTYICIYIYRMVLLTYNGLAPAAEATSFCFDFKRAAKS